MHQRPKVGQLFLYLERDLNDSRNSELRAILNYRKALVELERLQQTTLQNQNITVLQAGAGG